VCRADITSIFNLDDILPNIARGAFNDLIDQIKWGNGDGRGFAVSGGSSKVWHGGCALATVCKLPAGWPPVDVTSHV
jgi:hypothetical protein